MNDCKKRFFKSRDAAEQFAKSFNLWQQSAYYCPFCRCWHLTTGEAGRLNKLRMKSYENRKASKEWIERRARRCPKWGSRA